MQDRESLRILVVSGDDRIAQEVLQKVRAKFRSLPMQIDVESSTRRAVSEFRERLHEIVLIVAGAALNEVPQTVLQLQSISGSAQMIILSHQAPTEPLQGVRHFQTPVLQWETLMLWIREAIPEHLALSFGLERLVSPLRKVLEEYAKRYQVASTAQAETVEPIFLAPSLYFEAREESSVTSSARPLEERPGERASEPQVRRALTSEESRRLLRIELAVLGSLAVITVLIFVFSDSGESERIISLRNIFAAGLLIAIGGFFLSRRLERI